jgi:hypothetical protein
MAPGEYMQAVYMPAQVARLAELEMPLGWQMAEQPGWELN